MFKLTQEQVAYLKEEYTASTRTINNVEPILNATGIVEDAEDYFELVQNIIAQFYSIKLDMFFEKTKEDRLEKYMTLESIVILELKRKYANYIGYNAEIDNLLGNKDNKKSKTL